MRRLVAVLADPAPAVLDGVGDVVRGMAAWLDCDVALLDVGWWMLDAERMTDTG
jgi:hypothetical protein